MTRITFDTSALNHLSKSLRGDELADLFHAWDLQPVLHVPSIVEICKTTCPDRRAHLLRFAETLRHHGGWKLLDEPSSVARLELDAWNRGLAECSFSPPDELGLYRLLAHPETVTNEERLLCIAQCEEWDRVFLKLHGPDSEGRAKLRKLSQEDAAFARESPLKWMRRIWNHDLGFLLADFFEPRVGRTLDSQQIRQLLLEVPTNLCFFAAQLEAIHHHGIRGEELKHATPKWMDLSQFVYLGVADILVTDDRRQRERMQRLCRAFFPTKAVWSSQQLLGSVLFA